MMSYIPIDLEKIIIHYIGEHSLYEYLCNHDSKNYTMTEYCKFLMSINDIQNYSIVKAELISKKYQYAKINLCNKELLDLQLKTCLEILDYLEQLGDLIYKRSDHLRNVICYKNYKTINTVVVLNFEVKILKSRKELSSYFSQDIATYYLNKYYTVMISNHGFCYFYADDYDGVSGKFDNGLWALFLSILREQYENVMK